MNDDSIRGRRNVGDPSIDEPVDVQAGGMDRGPQLLRMLTLLASFGMDPMAPALLVP